MMTAYRQQMIALAVALALASILGWRWFQPSASYDARQLSGDLIALPDRSRIQIELSGHTLTVEVVNRPGSIRQGLSGRHEIGSDGMLFIMPAKTHHSFWMPDMNFDIDILWFDEDTLTETTSNVPAPPPGTPNSELPLYPSKQPANIILELPAGQAAVMGIKAGDSFKVIK